MRLVAEAVAVVMEQLLSRRNGPVRPNAAAWLL
jgi:hypothetical protein